MREILQSAVFTFFMLTCYKSVYIWNFLYIIKKKAFCYKDRIKNNEKTKLNFLVYRTSGGTCKTVIIKYDYIFNIKYLLNIFITIKDY